MYYTRTSLLEKFHSDITLTFFRHGEARRYEERGENGISEEYLTDKGKGEVEMSARVLAQEIKHRDEIALVWASPRLRTQQTAQILTDTLAQCGAYVVKRSPRAKEHSFEVVTGLQSPNLSDEFWRQKPEGASFVALWKELTEKDVLPTGAERYDAHEERLKQVLESARRVAMLRKKHSRCPKLRIISICHFETVTPILQEGYGGEIGVAREKGLRKTEYLHVDMMTLRDTKEAILHMNFKKGLPQDTLGRHDVYVLFREGKLEKLL